MKKLSMALLMGSAITAFAEDPFPVHVNRASIDTMFPGTTFAPYDIIVDATIANNSTKTVAAFWVAVTFYDRQGNPIGSDRTTVEDRVRGIAPGKSYHLRAVFNQDQRIVWEMGSALAKVPDVEYLYAPGTATGEPGEYKNQPSATESAPGNLSPKILNRSAPDDSSGLSAHTEGAIRAFVHEIHQQSSNKRRRNGG
jgi:hypothetical protein